MNELFRKFAHKISEIVGSPVAFVFALLAIIGWAFAGKYFNYSESWQLVVNTATTILTFLIVFLIQNTQNRDTKALHLKLDELLRAFGPARNSFVNLENMSDEELAKLEAEFRQFSEKARQAAEKRRLRRAAAREQAAQGGAASGGDSGKSGTLEA